MKNMIIIVLLAVAIGVGGLYLKESQKASEAEASIASLRQNISELEGRLSQQEERSATLQTRLKDTRAKAVAKSEEVSHLEEALTNRTQAAAKTANPMAEMLKNPDMKEFVKVQQKTVLSGMIDKNYASLFSSLGLNPEQSAPLKDLILKKNLIDAQAGISMMSGENDPGARAQLFEQAKSEKEAINDQIKQMLGDEHYPRFESYEKSQPERMSIGMFKDQQASGPGALTPDQEENLIQALTQERQNFKFTTDFYDQSKVASDLAGNLNEEKITQFQQERTQLQQKLVERARTILSSEQMTPFEKFLSTQGQMQNAGLKMAVKMFGPKAGN